MAIKSVRKRDGRTVAFRREKIAEAIFRAAQSVGGSDRQMAEKLASRAVSLLEKKFKRKTPSVEDIQDTAEKVLIKEGHAKTAKAYILYRQERTAIRQEKERILEKKSIDELEKGFDINALKVLKARYLRKTEDGRLAEWPKQMFTRVAVHAALPDLLYDPLIFDIKGKQKKHAKDLFDPVKHEGKASIGRYRLNRWNLEALKMMHDRLASQGRMKAKWSRFFEMLKRKKFSKYEKAIEAFYNLMASKKFLPNTPAIANFGNPLGMGSACFVVDVQDSIESIMEALKTTAIIFQSGGGMGYNFSRLRPESDYISTTGGRASGPASFMRLFDTMTEVVKQGGIRRGANMGILNINHPDIEKFIKSKQGNRALRNFNISVMILPDFWEHYKEGKPYPLINPRTGQKTKAADPKQLFDMAVYQAWESAEPGVIFLDTVNKHNPFYESLGPIWSTNPCGEAMLYPNESCNLGSINLRAFVADKEGKKDMDLESLKGAVSTAVHFLDNVIDVNKYPLKEIEAMTLNTRKTGLGIMGLADTLFELSVAYDSEEGFRFMERMMELFSYWSKKASVQLARERGSMPYFSRSSYAKGILPFSGFEDKKNWTFDWQQLADEIKKEGIRNGYTTVIAPTGSISMIAGCSSGIEPLYSLAFEKHVHIGEFYYMAPAFEKRMKSIGLLGEKLMSDIAQNKGSIRKLPYVSDKFKKVFVTAMDISPENHIRALAAFQKWTDSSISKTINFPADATVDDMKKSYLLAYRLGCKDLTVFRDTSIKSQVLRPPATKAPEQAVFSEQPQDERKCHLCGAPVRHHEGCFNCTQCGYGICT
ncbi:MAG: adenosylcobalamin-dependent ribonucleoside-diphosphate reductase [Candidatus Aenigmarchaeota archaeon]|nr:adenosylcobalamin-dependent ribonucleoside-diphosphate reductase [Candidatus Aenigmarchaeota archaeon]